MAVKVEPADGDHKRHGREAQLLQDDMPMDTTDLLGDNMDYKCAQRQDPDHTLDEDHGETTGQEMDTMDMETGCKRGRPKEPEEEKVRSGKAFQGRKEVCTSQCNRSPDKE